MSQTKKEIVEERKNDHSIIAISEEEKASG